MTTPEGKTKNRYKHGESQQEECQAPVSNFAYTRSQASSFDSDNV